MMQRRVRVRAFAPATVGNVGPGLDVLGCALSGPGDVVVAEWGEEPGITVRASGHPELPTDAARHTAAIAAAAVLRQVAGASAGIALSVEKGLPLSAGQGGSAASAVAGAVAASALLGLAPSLSEIIAACLAAEECVAGRHADNIAPALLGGFVLVRSIEPLDLVQLTGPAELRVVLALPDQRLRTAEARAVLPASLPRDVALHQAAQVAAMVAALATGDLALLGRAVDDRIAEPARAPLVRGFREAKAAALGAGALGASLSGSGPTTFALAAGDAVAARVAEAMQAAYGSCGVACAVRVERINGDGATVAAWESDRGGWGAASPARFLLRNGA